MKLLTNFLFQLFSQNFISNSIYSCFLLNTSRKLHTHCWIWGSHSTDYKVYYHLWCDAM
jgi:hypothetical protein